jgi:hypothetical protein
MRLGNERRKESEREWMKESTYGWMNENKRAGKKKYETKYKTFLNELLIILIILIICFLTVVRTSRTVETRRRLQRFYTRSVKETKSWCFKNQVSYGAHSSEIILHRSLLTKLRLAHAHLNTSGTLCSVQRLKICNHISYPEFPFMLPEWATEFNISVKVAIVHYYYYLYCCVPIGLYPILD